MYPGLYWGPLLMETTIHLSLKPYTLDPVPYQTSLPPLQRSPCISSAEGAQDRLPESRFLNMGALWSPVPHFSKLQGFGVPKRV